MSTNEFSISRSRHEDPQVAYLPLKSGERVVNESSVTQNWNKRKISDARDESPMTHSWRMLMQSDDLNAG